MSELKAGRDLDALIAEKVMGWTRIPKERETLWQSPTAGSWPVTLARIPKYSTDIAAAWKVVNALGGHFILRRQLSEWFVTINGEMAWAETAPLAICRAGIAATEAKP